MKEDIRYAKIWWCQVIIPNLAIAVGGIFLAVLCWGAMGWISSWDNQEQVYKYLIGGASGIAVCLIPFLCVKNGRKFLMGILKSMFKFLLILSIIWGLALMEHYEYKPDHDLMGYFLSMFMALSAFLSVLSCCVGILAGIIIFIIFIFQKEPDTLWEYDSTTTEGD